MAKKMTEAALRRVIESWIVGSSWYDETETQDNYRQALDSYYGRNKPKTTDGLSAAVDQSVAAMVEAVVSQMMPGFDLDEVAVFDARGAADVDQARLESRVCNMYLQDKNRGYATIQEALRNALLLRNGILKVWTEEEVQVTTRHYEAINSLELEMAMLKDAPVQEVEIVGEPTLNGGDDSIDISIKKTTWFRRLSVDSVDTTEFIVPKNYWDIDLSGSPMVGERYFLTASDLRGLGISQKQIDKLGTGETAQTSSRGTGTGINPRNRGSDNTNEQNNHGDKSMSLYECFEMYIKIDFDGDGVAERRRFLYVGGVTGGTVLKNEPWPSQPYASGTPFLQPQRWLGMSLYDKLREIENMKTDALRQYSDNLAYANNAEVLAVDGAVVMEDLKARRPGGINRVDDINAVRELVVRSNGQESQSFLNYMDQVRSEMGGASLDLQNAQLQLAGDTAHGVERQYTSKEQLAQLMTRTLAETLIRQTMLLIHEELRRQFPERAEINLGNQFISYAPGDWPVRDELTIVAGMTVSERRDRRAALEGVLMQQEKLFGAGMGAGILSDMQTYHSSLIDWTSAGGLRNPRRYWIDPRSDQSIEAQQTAQTQKQQASEQQANVERRLFDTQLQIENSKVRADLLKSAGQIQFNYWKETLDSSLQEQQFDLQYGGNLSEPQQTDELQAVGTARTLVPASEQ